jgi:hypothetical protein
MRICSDPCGGGTPHQSRQQSLKWFGASAVSTAVLMIDMAEPSPDRPGAVALVGNGAPSIGRTSQAPRRPRGQASVRAG